MMVCDARNDIDAPRRIDDAVTTWGYAEVSAAVLRHFDPRLSNSAAYRVLEAGGGSDSWLPLPPTAEITTIDISAEQLANNTYAREKLLGDLQSFDYGTRRFDLITCWDVLEHLERPADAVARLLAALAPEGRLLIKGPLRRSLKGLITRATPHSAHVGFYRHILGSRTAGTPGYPPFKAHLAPGSDPAEIAALARQNGLMVDAIEMFESMHIAAIAAKGRSLLASYRATEAVMSALTRGRYVSGATDFFLIARRPVR